MAFVSIGLLCLIAVPLVYLVLLAVASVKTAAAVPADRPPSCRFIVAVPAHDEASVISATVQSLRRLDYPTDLYSIHVVADHCSDRTAAVARQAGATVHERHEQPRSGKGAALSWLFGRVLGNACDAVIVLDADTRVAPDFLRVMNAKLLQGYPVIQGQHVISNYETGWFPSLVWAMFIVDNRFQNLGRTRLGWSAKNMGDSVCIRSDILRRLGWGDGLTDDYYLRQQLLLENIHIVYEPSAVGYGEAPRSWTQARAQRARWLSGTHDARKRFGRHLLVEAVTRRDCALLDGALQTYLPSYSTLAVCSAAALLTQLAVNRLSGPVFGPGLLAMWCVVLATLVAYPLLALALERAPVRAYAAMALGPLFIVWRTWLALTSRLWNRPTVWVRTSHGLRG